MRGTAFSLAIFLAIAPFPASRAQDDPIVIDVAVDVSRDRQIIDGFGGSLAYWGYNADEATLSKALGEMGASIVRIPAEVAQSGDPEAYRDAVRRVGRVAPGAKIYLTFWQPRSREKPRPEDWLDVDASGKYRLRPGLAPAWADEMVARTRRIREGWGANVVAIGIQNEPNFSVPGTPTCAWEPADLARFGASVLAPRLAESGLGLLPIASPELAYVGAGAGEARRFAPTLSGPTAGIFSYHMYDSYKQGEADPGLDGVRERQKALGKLLSENLPSKRLWMTETTGAQFNGDEWHTLGWSPSLDDHEKAIAAVRYMHSALVDAGANAFLWWGLVYSEAPSTIVGERERRKFRDEGLIVVKAEADGQTGTHAFLERTTKSYAFQQFAGFVRPGWVRLDVADPRGPRAPLVAAFRSPDGRKIALVLIRPETSASGAIEPRISGDRAYRLEDAFVTDRARRCERSTWTGSLAAESVTTILYGVVDEKSPR